MHCGKLHCHPMEPQAAAWCWDLVFIFWLTILLLCGYLYSWFFASSYSLLGLWQSSPRAHPWSSACLQLRSLCPGGCEPPWSQLWFQHRYASIYIWNLASQRLSIPTLSNVYGIAHLDDPPLAKAPWPEPKIHHLLPFLHCIPIGWSLFLSTPIFS